MSRLIENSIEMHGDRSGIAVLMVVYDGSMVLPKSFVNLAFSLTDVLAFACYTELNR